MNDEDEENDYRTRANVQFVNNVNNRYSCTLILLYYEHLDRSLFIVEGAISGARIAP